MPRPRPAMLAAIFSEIEKYKTAGPDPQELADTKEAMLRSFETGLRQNNYWLNQLVADYQRGAEPGAAPGELHAGDLVRHRWAGCSHRRR